MRVDIEASRDEFLKESGDLGGMVEGIDPAFFSLTGTRLIVGIVGEIIIGFILGNPVRLSEQGCISLNRPIHQKLSPSDLELISVEGQGLIQFC